MIIPASGHSKAASIIFIVTFST